MNENRLLYNYYLSLLGEMPSFLEKYASVPVIQRLKNIDYFCGAKYANHDIYGLSENISRYDHSIDVALITWKITHDKYATLAGLFHDVATPCFSHAIDYMNKDYVKQESTEEYTLDIMKSDSKLMKLFTNDNIRSNDIADFKKYTIVDSERPKLCADRFDGIILTGISWVKCIDEYDINLLVRSLTCHKDLCHGDELSFSKFEAAKLAMDVNYAINKLCHQPYDFYMMDLLSKIASTAIQKGYISQKSLYKYNETELFEFFKQVDDKDINYLINLYFNINRDNIPYNIDMPKLKNRTLLPRVNGHIIENY